MFKKIYLLVVLTILLTVLGFLFSLWQKNQDHTSSNNDYFHLTQGGYDYFSDISDLPSCENKKELFATSPLKLTDFTTIDPLGLLSPSAHTFPAPHLYFRISRPGGFSEINLAEILWSDVASEVITQEELIDSLPALGFDQEGAIRFLE